jgi:hypothetical protein
MQQLFCIVVIVFIVSTCYAYGIDKAREEELITKMNEFWQRQHELHNPPPPCQGKGRESDRAAKGHPYSTHTGEACELACRQYLGEKYTGWFSNSGLVLLSNPPQMYCHCCEQEESPIGEEEKKAEL